MLIHTMFLGADGVDPKWGVSCYSSDEAELNAAMVRQARRHIAVVDNTKLDVVANYRICEAAILDTLITDTGAKEEKVAPYEGLGVKVLRV